MSTVAEETIRSIAAQARGSMREWSTARVRSLVLSYAVWLEGEFAALRAVLKDAQDGRTKEVEAWKKKAAELGHKLDAPIPMRLTCPECRALHIDTGEFATKPHHTHSCQECGLTWRPAVVNTVGVRFLPGFRNATASEWPRETPSRYIPGLARYIPGLARAMSKRDVLYSEAVKEGLGDKITEYIRNDGPVVP